MREEILYYIIDNTDKDTFEKAMQRYDLHSLYRRKKNYLVYTCFNGNTLRYSNYMTALFGQFITEGAQLEAAELAVKINDLAWRIRVAKKYRSPHSELAKEHNALVLSYNEVMAGVNKLIKLWNKRHKKLKQAA